MKPHSNFGKINQHNFVYWAKENPHIVEAKTINVPGTIVCHCLSSRGLIRPYFFEETVTGQTYLQINTFKYHVFAPMGRFQLELINLYCSLPFHLTVGCFCPVNCPSQETEVTSTPTKPVENVVTT